MTAFLVERLESFPHTLETVCERQLALDRQTNEDKHNEINVVLETSRQLEQTGVASTSIVQAKLHHEIAKFQANIV